MVSHELQRKKHGLWLDQDSSSAHVAPMHVEGVKDASSTTDDSADEQYAFHPAGLFPSLLRYASGAITRFRSDR
jgi:hypothetical protein